MGGCLIYEMGAPKLGENGEIIEDEFTHLPSFQQYIKRMWKEMTFYQKVWSIVSKGRITDYIRRVYGRVTRFVTLPSKLSESMGDHM